ncbi:hypothetical protein [Natrinema salifodinae]|uniref:Uncharacterized protein n=1 Tax=Natrinema salifodinae TaxID=1202768 RepID=A0A1I0PBS3_9EURY|nr:hypothetical protein [Natrinema salifodinae]SEW11030.1 hypothetical protein SAMN05216285_2314 [Natrinema salifodinae]
MASLQGIAGAVLGFAVVLGCTGVVYRDARRIGVSRPHLWAGFVFVTCGGGLGIFLSPLDVPVPGLLVIVIAGPALYLFERDDARHGDEPADPHVLPDGRSETADSDGSDGDERTANERRSDG